MINEILELTRSLPKLQKEIQVHQKKSNRLIQRLVTKESIFEGWSSRSKLPVDQIQLKYFLQFLIEIKSFLSKFTDKQYIFHSWKHNIDYEAFSDYNKQFIEFAQSFQLDANLDVIKYQTEDKQDTEEDVQTILSYIEKLPTLPTEITNQSITKEIILQSVQKALSRSSSVVPQAEYHLDATQINELTKKISLAKAVVLIPGENGQFLSIEPSALTCEKSHINKLNDGKFGFLNYKGIYQDTKPVAIKYLPSMNANQTKLLQEEVATLQSLEGTPYFVKYYGLQHTALPHCLAFELINFTLYEALYSREKPTLVIAKENIVRKLSILLECAIGLDYLHSLAIPHGDLKSANVLIDVSGHVKLCGFGLLKTKQAVVPTIANHASIAAKLQALLLISSPQYLAPEIYESNSMDSVTTESDIYAFGVLLNEVLDHAPPFPNLTAQNISTRLKRSDPSSRPLLFGRNEDIWQTGNGLVLELQTMIKRCWENIIAIRPISKHVYQVINRIVFRIHSTEGGISFGTEENHNTTSHNNASISSTSTSVAAARKSFIVTTESSNSSTTNTTTNKQPVTSLPSPSASKGTLQRAVSRLKMIDFFESNIKRHAEANNTRPYPNNTAVKRMDGNVGPLSPSCNTNGTSFTTHGSTSNDDRLQTSILSEAAAERSIILEEDDEDVQQSQHEDSDDDEANTNLEVVDEAEVLAGLNAMSVANESHNNKAEEKVVVVVVESSLPVPPPVAVVATAAVVATTTAIETVDTTTTVTAAATTSSSSTVHHQQQHVTVNVTAEPVASPPSPPATPDVLEINLIDSTNTVKATSTTTTTTAITTPVVAVTIEETLPTTVTVVTTTSKPSSETIFKINTLFYQASNCGAKSAQEELLLLARDYPLAEVFLMGMLCYGSGIEKDLNKAQEIAIKSIDWLLTLAASEDPADSPANMYAQYLTGICYEQGLAVAKDEREAVKYYTLSATQGYAGAQSNLGYCYKHGQGVVRDMHEALRLYTLGAEQGHATGNLPYIVLTFTTLNLYTVLMLIAQNNLGYCYQHGQGIGKDLTKAVHYYKLSAEQGYANYLFLHH